MRGVGRERVAMSWSKPRRDPRASGWRHRPGDRPFRSWPAAWRSSPADVKQRVGQRPADALVEQDEHGGHALTLVREAVTLPSAIAFQQAVALHLARVIAELGEGV